MTSHEIRAKYLEFFGARKHAITPSSSLVPENDPSTLFTGSGMQPMVPYLLGQTHPLGRRLANSQRAFRSQDIEEVGDNRHTTFFEMLGNWSFGDYFKKEQIPWMWQFLTEELRIPPEQLYITCFRGNEELNVPRDEESAQLWQELFGKVNIDARVIDFAERDGMQGGRIFYYDDKKNWWSRVGVPGNMPVGEPGGPDTEMFFDFYPELGNSCIPDSVFKGDFCHVNCDCGRFMEIGNNVFMEYRKTTDGFEELSQKNVDFGGGLERLLAAVQNQPDIFLSDLFESTRKVLEELSSKKYSQDEKTTYAFRVILDHIRASVFLISDGVLPSNTDQGYVLRRLIRRAVRYMDTLGIEAGKFSELSSSIIETYRQIYSELAEKEPFIKSTLAEEEKKFRGTLHKGLKEFERRAFNNTLSGEDAFILFSSYGFPFEITQELAAERGITVLPSDYQEALQKHQELSRSASAGKFKGGLADNSEVVTAYHSATHLLLAGLRKELGEDVHQAGSNITAERTRFDFTYPVKVEREILDRVEQYVQEAVIQEAEMKTVTMNKEEARAAGVEGSFWEKYPDQVTVYEFTGKNGVVYSQELCGGPHVENAGVIKQFGVFKIVKEEASSRGVRRIKGVFVSE